VHRRREIALAFVLVAAACCGGGANIKRTYPPPAPEQILAHLRSVRDRVTSLKAETISDARIGKERAKVTVLIMATWGGKLRFMAMNPSGDGAADLASDGMQYCFLDRNKNCGDCGPATPENVGRLIRIVMPPDDVVTFLLGSTPVLADAKATVAWDANNGQEVVTLVNGPYVQKIVLDGRDQRWDVLESEVMQSGKLLWRVRHKDYHVVGSARLPGKSYFEQPDDNVLIQWREQEVNVDIPDDKFKMTPPAGLLPCP
jgi:outer membrane lipoprotein-sorting protein